MATRQPFVLFDDAREEGASDAQLFENPREIFVARRPEEVASVLAAADAARRASGGTLAGYLAYEAGLALEPKLMPLADDRSGGAGPLVWLALFDAARTIPAADMPAWLDANQGEGPPPCPAECFLYRRAHRDHAKMSMVTRPAISAGSVEASMAPVSFRSS